MDYGWSIEIRRRQSILGHRIKGRDRGTRQRKMTGIVMLLSEIRGLWLPSVLMLLIKFPEMHWGYLVEADREW